MDAVTSAYLLIETFLLIGTCILYFVQERKMKVNSLDKALCAVIYITLAVGVYPAILSSLEENRTSHVYMDNDILSKQECLDIIDAAADEADIRQGWTTRRHKAYPTTDVSVYEMNSNLSSFVSWLNATIESRVFPHLTENFFVPSTSFIMRDLFIVKYTPHGQESLPEHRDNSKISFNIALSSHDIDFEGGGTSFTLPDRTINIPAGSLLPHDSGVYHAGKSVTNGTRYILVGFVNTQEEYWWRAFGSSVRCMSFPVDDLHAVVSSTGRRTTCRTFLWVVTHQLQRIVHNIQLLVTDSDGSTLGVSDNMRVVMLSLSGALVILILILIYVCVGGDISAADAALLKAFSSLSEEESAYLELQRGGIDVEAPCASSSDTRTYQKDNRKRD